MLFPARLGSIPVGSEAARLVWANCRAASSSGSENGEILIIRVASSTDSFKLPVSWNDGTMRSSWLIVRSRVTFRTAVVLVTAVALHRSVPVILIEGGMTAMLGHIIATLCIVKVLEFSQKIGANEIMFFRL